MGRAAVNTLVCLKGFFPVIVEILISAYSFMEATLRQQKDVKSCQGWIRMMFIPSAICSVHLKVSSPPFLSSPNNTWSKSAYDFLRTCRLASAVSGTSPVTQICRDGCCTCSASIFSRSASEYGLLWIGVLFLQDKKKLGKGLVFSPQKGVEWEHLTQRRSGWCA